MFKGPSTCIPLCFALAVSISAQSSNRRDYQCTITKVTHVTTVDGDPDRVSEMITQSYAGKQFTVERVSGVMAGILGNSSPVMRPQVLDVGSPEHAYAVVASIKRDPNLADGTFSIVALYIEEFADSPRKPFALFTGDITGADTFYGRCEHF